MKDRTPGDTIRIWVPGCSTGEEAYSHAICLAEYLGEMRADASFQIFGSDISVEAIEKARAGIYKESIQTDVSAARLRRFFNAVEGGYQISKAIRDMCVFATQNVFKDPPFSRMDIVSCRNVLIYMSSTLQKRVIPILHYALKPKGFLMVGSTEGIVGTGAELFEVADNKHKIYHKRLVASPVQFNFALDYHEPRARRAETGAALPTESAALKVTLELQREADRLMLARYGPAAVVVNDRLGILQTRGHTSRYLELPTGKASLDLLKMARPGLFFDLRDLIGKARKKSGVVRKENVRIENHDAPALVNLEVTPFKAPMDRGQNFLIVFEDVAVPAAPTARASKLQRAAATESLSAKDRQIVHLTQELDATKDYLQSIIEEQEATNEELQSANEEVQSGNEELQSTNEELQTSKEELESANEELNTVNEETQHRNAQLTLMTNDLTNLLTSVNIPMVMLGPDLSIRRYTPQAENALELSANDIGRPITNLKLKINVPELETLLLDVIRGVRPWQEEVQDQGGTWHRLRLTPYRTSDNRIEGAVLTLLDINDLKLSIDELGIERSNLEEVLRQMACGLVIAEAPSGKLIRENSRLHEVLSRTISMGDDVLGYADYALHPGAGPYRPEEWPIARSMAGEVVTEEEVEWIREDGSHVFVMVSSAPIRSKTGTIIGVVATFFDLTARHTAEEMLRASEQTAATGRLAAALAHEINNPLEIITNAVFLLSEDKTLGEGAREYARMANDQLRRIGHISNSLLGLYRRALVSETFRIRDVLDEVVGLYEAKIAAKNIRVIKRYDCDGEMHGSSTEVRQIFLNLVGNAVEAVGENATLTLRISASRHWKDLAASGIRISVADNGPGIAREHRPRIFEPFFTTKIEKGTGLGLWICSGIVNKYGGDIRMRSSTVPGKSGTLFSVFFPAHDVSKPRRSKAAEEGGVRRAESASELEA